MFKYVIVVLALIAAALAAPQVFYNTPASYSYTNGGSYVKPVAAVYSSGAYVPSAYSASSYVAPVAYNAYPYAYL